jgi:hypothetical protein
MSSDPPPDSPDRDRDTPAWVASSSDPQHADATTPQANTQTDTQGTSTPPVVVDATDPETQQSTTTIAQAEANAQYTTHLRALHYYLDQQALDTNDDILRHDPEHQKHQVAYFQAWDYFVNSNADSSNSNIPQHNKKRDADGEGQNEDDSDDAASTNNAPAAPQNPFSDEPINIPDRIRTFAARLTQLESEPESMVNLSTIWESLHSPLTHKQVGFHLDRLQSVLSDLKKKYQYVLDKYNALSKSSREEREAKLYLQRGREQASSLKNDKHLLVDDDDSSGSETRDEPVAGGWKTDINPAGGWMSQYHGPRPARKPKAKQFDIEKLKELGKQHVTDWEKDEREEKHFEEVKKTKEELTWRGPGVSRIEVWFEVLNGMRRRSEATVEDDGDDGERSVGEDIYVGATLRDLDDWAGIDGVRHQPRANAADREPRTPQRQRQHQAPDNRNEDSHSVSQFMTDEEMAESPTPSDEDQLYDNADASSGSSAGGNSDVQDIGWEGGRSRRGDATAPITIPRGMSSTQGIGEDEMRVATDTPLPRSRDVSGIGPVETGGTDGVGRQAHGEVNSQQVEGVGERQAGQSEGRGLEGTTVVARDAMADLTDAFAGTGMNWKENVKENLKEKGGRFG